MIQLLNALVLLLACGAYAISIPAAPIWPDGRCTDKSLTRPNWIISQYKVQAGTASFYLNNQGSNPGGFSSQFSCRPGKTECDGSAGSVPAKATLSVVNGQSVISITDFWTCGDESDRVNFRASGKTTITSCSGNDCVSPITYLVPGTLNLPIPLTPIQPTPPPGFDSPTCGSISDHQWSVVGLEYKNYTRGQCKQWYFEDFLCMDDNFANAENFTLRGQYLHLDVTNNAISHKVTCDFTPKKETSPYTPNIPIPFRCTGGNFNEITLEVTLSGNPTSTGPFDFTLKIEEVWYCLLDAKNSNRPTLMAASGSTNVSMDCNVNTGITGTASDVVTLCKSKGSLNVPGQQVAKNSLPEFSLVVAPPAHGGCTYDSIVNPTFWIRSPRYTVRPDDSLSSFDVGLNGPNFGPYWIYTNKNVSGTGLDTVYTCSSWYDGTPRDKKLNCYYAFNVHTKTMWLRKVWECNDKNPSTRLFFQGSGTIDFTVNPNYYCSSDGNTCSWYTDIDGIPYDVTKVTVSLEHALPPDYGQWLPEKPYYFGTPENITPNWNLRVARKRLI
ncbi:hypothetical protein P154DRAFT_619886 [Amniculicola lignicola CBS 123094]|uniref:AA1-like domain-containing protein n=1 Tax=Amniculicola lignicola CBS 123094 TaxID=1392246 RepID=A0A6A5WKF7_9PLEO|nr:hypothetical protein P154DRAFT_619886 [Amniculicola lignicola CBS 123094]